MQLDGKNVVVTGGAHGIGAAMCRRFAAEGASLVVADLDKSAADAVAGEIGGVAVGTDVGDAGQMATLVETAIEQLGHIDLFCSNAGIETGGDVAASDELWEKIWHVNVMAHVYAARYVVPHMIERGGGYLLQTASAAGLLTQITSAPYSVTKHAAVAFGEWLTIRYGHQGIKVSCLCPQGVKTSMLVDAPDEGIRDFLLAGALEPQDVAEVVVDGLAKEEFLILPHPEVATYFQHKATDYDRWIRGMQRLYEGLYGDNAPAT